MPEKLDLETRETLFRLSVSQFIQEYDKKLLEQFADYWTEPNKSQTKMKWELERTWDLSRRIKRWFNNQIQWNGHTQTDNGLGKKSGGFGILTEALRQAQQ